MKRRVLAQTTLFHRLFIKKKVKKPETVPFWTALWVFFSPWTHKVGEEEDFSSSVFHHHLSLKKTPTNPTCPKLSTCWRKGRIAVPRVVEGRLHSGRPVHISPLFLPINTGETRRDEKGEEKREGKREGEDWKQKKKKAEKRTKNRGERVKKKTEPLSANKINALNWLGSQ